jgi:hypothetical protein
MLFFTTCGMALSLRLSRRKLHLRRTLNDLGARSVHAEEAFLDGSGRRGSGGSDGSADEEVAVTFHSQHSQHSLSSSGSRSEELESAAGVSRGTADGEAARSEGTHRPVPSGAQTATMRVEETDL